MIVLDTSVLSEVFRRGPRPAESQPAAARELSRILRERDAFFVPGIVLQELLSGSRDQEVYDRLRAAMVGYPVWFASHADHLAAASISNRCRWNGIAAGHIDCLVAAQTLAADASLFTLDKDFERIAPLCDLRLWRVGR